MKQQYLGLLVAGVISTFVVAGCGGGGDGSSSANSGTAATPGSGTATPASSASAPVIASAPIVPQPASAPVASSQPVTVGEALPTLSNPQAGSTAATASGPIGVWSATNSLGYQTVALIDPHNNLSTLNAIGSFVESDDFTSLTLNGNAWSMNTGVTFDDTTGLTGPINSGSGTYAAEQTFSGSINRNGTSSTLNWNYNAENALAVTQASVTGTWATSSASFTIGSDGTVSGTLSGCNMSGTLMLATPNSNQNMYDMVLTASPSTGCKLPAGTPLSGSAAILFVPISGSNGFQRSIIYVLHSANYGYVAYGQVITQS